MKSQHVRTTLGLIGCLCAGGIRSHAGSATYNFDSDPSAVLKLFGTSTWSPTDGNPAAGGYLSITDAINSQRGAIVFDDFDNGLVVKAFSFSMDVRIGGGTDTPADGISINYVRAGDPVLTDPLNGWATGPNGEADLPEEGATTGLAIGFDAYYSGGDNSWNGAGRPGGSASLTDDVIGMSVRIDNKLVYQFALPTLNGAVGTDPTSLQTGPQDANNAGSPDLLTWQPLSVNLAEDGTLIIKYKGVELTPAGGLHTTFAPSPGRLVLVGRTGGANQNNHVDNIQITTIPATTPTIGTVAGKPDGFSFTITDAAPIAVDPATVSLVFNGAPLAVSSSSKSAGATAVVAKTAVLIPPGSTNTVVASFKDTLGNSYSANRTFVQIDYAVVPTAYALPDGAVDTSKGGFRVRSYETATDNQNSLALAEEELQGLLGANLVDSSKFDASGFFTETGVINYTKVSTGDGTEGNFGSETEIPGFPGTGPNNYDYAAMEILTYAYFPAAGTYTWGVSSDDGFRVSVTPSVGEKLNAVVLGQFDGGRGASIPGTLFTFYVSKAGYYPIRAIWENGTGGANVELFSVMDDGSMALVNDPTAPGAIRVYSAASVVRPYVVTASPEPGLFAEGRNVPANSPLKVVLADGSAATVDSGSIRLLLNGATVTPTVAKTGTQTTVSQAYLYPNLLPVGTNTATVIYTAGGGTPVTNSWNFLVAPYATLNAGLASPVGSGDPANPGFRIKTYQIDVTSPTAGTAGANQAPNLVSFAEQELLGLFGPNVASTTGFTGGYYHESAVLNYDKDPTNDGQQGNFGGEALFPGIPGTTVYSGATDNFALEIQTYIEFPAAGYYTLGFNSDDGFATYESTGPVSNYALAVTAPSAIAGAMGAISGGTDEGGIGLPLPTTPITGKVVYAQPPLADSDITNVADVTNNIVLIDRGTSTFTDKFTRAIKAGAKAVIVVNNRDETSTDGILPILMTGVSAPIAGVMVNIHDGQKLKDHLADAGGVTVSIGQDPTPKLGVYNGGRGASDTLFSIAVPQAGVYPIRTVYFQGGGGANAEFFSVAADGTKTLINDPSAAGALKSYSAVTSSPAPTLSVARSGADLIITYTGTLQASDTVNLSGFSNLAGASSPYRIVGGTTGAAKFFRATN